VSSESKITMRDRFIIATTESALRQSISACVGHRLNKTLHSTTRSTARHDTFRVFKAEFACPRRVHSREDHSAQYFTHML
jgi:hypothetical protein